MTPDSWLETADLLLPAVADAVAERRTEALPAVDALAMAVGWLVRVMGGASDAGDALPVGVDRLPDVLAVLVRATEPRMLSTVAELEAQLAGFADEVFRVALAIEAAESEPDDPPEAPIDTLDAISLSLDGAMEGGTIEAGERAAILLQADEVVSELAVLALLGETVPATVPAVVSCIGRRLWIGLHPQSSARLRGFIERECADRYLILDPWGAALWAEPGAPAWQMLPPAVPVGLLVGLSEWSMESGPVGVPLPGAAEHRAEPHAAPQLERVRLEAFAVGGDSDEARMLEVIALRVTAGELPSEAARYFPPGGAVDGLPNVVLAEVHGERVLLVSGATVTSAAQGDDLLECQIVQRATVIRYAWSVDSPEGMVRLVMEDAGRCWTLDLTPPRPRE